MAELRTELDELERTVLAEVSREELWRHATTLAQWEKVSGTEGERRAVDYLRSQLDRFGLETTLYEFESLLGWPEQARLELLEPETGRVDAITHSFVPSTPEAGLEGEVVDLGTGEEADFARGVRGKIGLIQGIASPLRVLHGSQAGAAALVFANQDGDRIHEMCVSPVWGTPTTRTASLLPNLPVVSIRQA